MLAVENISASYGKIRALLDVSMHVSEGETVAIIGANGAGKTTLLSTLSGLLRPDRGVVTFDSKVITNLSPEEIVRRGLVLVPEGRRIFTRLTVEENLLMAASLRMSRTQAAEEILRLNELFPALRKRFRMPAGNLSGGEQQQLALARGLLCKPKLLMLDEPSHGLAPILFENVLNVVRYLREQGLTVLMVEQFATRAVEFADRTYLLANGTVRAEGTREDFAKQGDFLWAYLGAEQEGRVATD